MLTLTAPEVLPAPPPVEELPKHSGCIVCGRAVTPRFSGKELVGAWWVELAGGKQALVRLCPHCQAFCETHPDWLDRQLQHALLKRCRRCGYYFLFGEAYPDNDGERRYRTTTGAFIMTRDRYLCASCAPDGDGDSCGRRVDICSVCDGTGDLMGRKDTYTCPECDGDGYVYDDD